MSGINRLTHTTHPTATLEDKYVSDGLAHSIMLPLDWSISQSQNHRCQNGQNPSKTSKRETLGEAHNYLTL